MNLLPDGLDKIPSVDSVLRLPDVVRFLNDSFSLQEVTHWVRVILDSYRTGSGILCSKAELSEEIIQRLVATMQSSRLRETRKVINATGIILHTNLGRAPLADVVQERMLQVAGACNLEYDKEKGARGKRGVRVKDLLVLLTGAEDVLVVNNCAAATWLALQTVVGEGDAIVSRGQLVEIGGSYRLPDIAESAGIRLKEVGTTNRTYIEDYENSIEPTTRALLRIHRSNFVMTGFVKEPKIADLVKLGNEHGIPVIDDLGSGCLHDLSQYHVNEPTVIESINSKADLVLFSGDKLLGGPQSGIILGRTELVQRLRNNPIYRALRVDKMTLAGLEATLELHLQKSALQKIPVLRMLSTSCETLKSRCCRIVEALSSSAAKDCLTIVDASAEMGGGALPGHSIPSVAIKLNAKNPMAVAKILRTASPSIVVRVVENSLYLDVRTINPEDDPQVIESLKNLPVSSLIDSGTDVE